ncbi:MAG: site-specific integrase [Planctomycetota bacterium]|nr:site-specific integrase [Planctomycetota bacterium]
METSAVLAYASGYLHKGPIKARAKHMSIRTEEAYLRWIEQFLRFHKQADGGWVHAAEMADAEINRFLTHLAVERKVSASTQNQAFSALLFLYKQVLKKEVKIDAVRAKQPERVPVVDSFPAGSETTDIDAGLTMPGDGASFKVCVVRDTGSETREPDMGVSAVARFARTWTAGSLRSGDRSYDGGRYFGDILTPAFGRETHLFPREHWPGQVLWRLAPNAIQFA